LILFGWLSDHIAAKAVILAGMLLAALTYYPLYSWLGTATQPVISLSRRDFHHLHPGAYVGMTYGPIGAFLGGILPGQDPLHVVSVALSHRQTGGVADWFRSSPRRPFSPPAASATR